MLSLLDGVTESTAREAIELITSVHLRVGAFAGVVREAFVTATECRLDADVIGKAVVGGDVIASA